jgi:diaminopimelate decarboxylase
VVRDAWLPADLAPGDLLAVAATGAYCYSMSSNYNKLPRPAVVSVAAGAVTPLLRRETEADVFRLEEA